MNLKLINFVRLRLRAQPLQIANYQIDVNMKIKHITKMDSNKLTLRGCAFWSSRLIT